MSFRLNVPSGSAGFARPLGLLLATVCAIAAVVVWAFWVDGAEPASATGAGMGIRVYADTAKSDLVCDLGTVSRKCDVDAGGTFSIDIVASPPPVDGYTAYHIALEYTSAFNLQQQPGFEEHLLGACLEGSEAKGSGSYDLGCKLTATTTFSGAIANVHFECKGGSGQIDLLGGTKAGASVYVKPGIFGSLVFLKSVTKGTTLVADAVQINCVDPSPTPTPTATRTSTSTATSTPTVTRTPTATATNPPGEKAKMGLLVYADKGKTDLACGLGPTSRKCDVYAGAGFSIDVLAESPPGSGYQAYKAVVQYSGDLTLQQQPGLSENRAPACMQGLETKNPAVGKVGQVYTISCKLTTTKTLYSGVLANINFVCGPNGGSGQIDLVAGTTAGVSVYLNPGIYGSVIFLKSEQKGNKQVADSVHVNCHADFDLDGCTNVQELGTNVMSGGTRNPSYFWDFFDVWTADAEAPGGFVRDRAVSISDVFAVALRFGAAGSPGDPEGALAMPLSESGYHPAFDRSSSSGGAVTNVGPADGGIGLTDVFSVAAQFGHSCA